MHRKYTSCRPNISTSNWWRAHGSIWNGSFSHTSHFRVIYKSFGNSCLHDVISMRTFSPPAGANSNRLHKRSLRRRSKGVGSQQEQRKLLWAGMKRTYNREPQRTPLVKKHGHQCKCPTKKITFPTMYIHTKAHLDSDSVIDWCFGSLSVTLHLLKAVFYVFILSNL